MKKLNNILLWSLLLASIPLLCAGTSKQPEAASKIVRKDQEISDQIKIHEETLDNGLRVIIVSLNSNGAVVAGVGYNVGSGDDPRDVVGISHFLEHMMFKGTKNISGNKLKEVIAKFNKTKNAFTSEDVTCYHYSCNKQFLDIDLKIEADRMQNLLLRKEDIAKEKEVIIEERKMRVESDPRLKYMLESAYKSMFLYSNYSYPVIGYLDQIKNCDRASLKRHYDKFYKPNNAFVLIVGDIEKEEALSKVKKYFGSIKMGAAVERNRVIDPEDTGLTHSIEHQTNQISTYSLDLVYRVNRSSIDNMKKHTAVTIATGILAGGISSILYENMVDKKELAYTLESQLDLKAYDSGRFSISTVFRENTTAAAVEAEIKNIVNNYVRKYLTTELVEKEKKKLLNNIDLMMDDPKSMFAFCIDNIVKKHKITEIKNAKDIINGITLDDVKRAAAETLSDEFMKIYSHPRKS